MYNNYKFDKNGRFLFSIQDFRLQRFHGYPVGMITKQQ